MTRIFGFAQFDFAGTLAVADGRYVVRDTERERVLVLRTLGAPPPPRRKRRRPRDAEAEAPPATLPLTRATAVSASEPFASAEAAARWLDDASSSEDAVDRALDEGIDLLNRALHAHSVASGDPHARVLTPRQAVAVRLGYGSGEEVAEGEYAAAREVDTGAVTSSKRQRRSDELRPQERLAAVLGGREQIDACETLLLRARADLDAGREREAALQLRAGLEALLVELPGALDDSGHEEDMATIESRRGEVTSAAEAALQGDLDAKQLTPVRELLALCERVLRRRRILNG